LHGSELHPHADKSLVEDHAGFVTPDRPRGPSTVGPRTPSGDSPGASRSLHLDVASPPPSTGDTAPVLAPVTAPGVTTHLQ
jgi:hypothetical protein